MGTDVQDLGHGGGGRPDLHDVIQSRCIGNNFYSIIDIGDEPPDCSNPGGFPPQCVQTVGGYADAKKYGGALVLYATSGGNVDGMTGGGGEIHPLLSEHHCTIYTESSDIGSVSGGRAVSVSAGSTYIVGKVRYGIVG